MRVTTKGQVTIPQHIRQKLGLSPASEVDFVEDGSRVYLVKNENSSRPRRSRFNRYRGAATIKMTTDEIMSLTRGEE